MELEKFEIVYYTTYKHPIFLVDGEFIRDNTYIDFTEGGSWLRYPTFIPEGEIWLDDFNATELIRVLIHETAEVTYALEHDLDITQEKDYSEAHDHANEIEQTARDNPEDRQDILAELLAKLNGTTEEKTLWTQPEKS